ncbi:MAG: hypothetical protein ING75_14615 [Rhodocyclaceae bacterium]|nr:hypothetical protein [Rhodocyclaceae bacterium]
MEFIAKGKSLAIFVEHTASEWKDVPVGRAKESVKENDRMQVLLRTIGYDFFSQNMETADHLKRFVCKGEYWTILSWYKGT